MRLLHVEELRFEEFPDENVPPYAIASHRWGAEEVTLQDIQQNRATSKIGYKKIQGFAKFAQENLKSINWIWIDTCCIDKTSAAELSEAVNLMFKWYRNAEICLAYLADVESVDEPRGCARSEWFRRGWTLQELLAPRVVVFLTNSWQLIGNKGATVHESILSAAGPGLEASIAAATGLPENLLHDFDTSKSIPQSEKLKWIEGRDATRKEDLSYALYGILGVYLGANYGEGLQGARDRLIAAVHEREGRERRQAGEFHKIKAWLDPPDPWTNHESARMGRTDGTGDWLLQSSLYQDWKDNDTRLLWLYGKAGCGKTILYSTVIEDIRVYCDSEEDIGYAAFYCTFSDARKQSLRDLLLSIVAQVCWREPGLAMLQKSRERPNRSSLSAEELEEILLSTLRACRIVYLMIDGLDECPEHNDNQRWVLEFLARLHNKASNIHILVASRDESSIRSSMQTPGAAQLPVDTHAVDADIRKYISAEILRDPKLSRLQSDTKAQIEDTLTQRADGMFRWTFCQLEEVKRLKSTKPKAIEQALSALPATLDATYERMLATIEDNVRDDALTLLRWIAYAQRPLNLEELVETTIIDLTQEASIDIENRGGLGDALEMLSGLVVTGPQTEWPEGNGFADFVDPDDHDTIAFLTREDVLDTTDDAGGANTLKWNTTVRLAHFSVKEFLESNRIAQGNARDFQLQSAREHWILAQSCLAYLLVYSNDAHKSSTLRDLRTFPLLLYAAERWYTHISFQSTEVAGREAKLLLHKEAKHDWWLIHQIHNVERIPFSPEGNWTEAPALHYASYLGLQPVVRILLDARTEVNVESDWLYSTALTAASAGGHDAIVKMLVKAGADLDLDVRGDFDTALRVATARGYRHIVHTLLDAGANLDAAEGYLSSAGYCGLVETACAHGHWEIAEILIKAGANVNTRSTQSPLVLASQRGDVDVVRVLLDAGMDELHWPLQLASLQGHRKVVRLLLEKAANVHATIPISETLIAASRADFAEAVSLLIEAGANVNAEGPDGSRALGVACFFGSARIVQILLDAGADINARGWVEINFHHGKQVNALEAALARYRYEHSVKIVEMLLAAGAVFEKPIKERLNDALVTASGTGAEDLVQRLIREGADVNASRQLPQAMSEVTTDIGGWATRSETPIPGVINALQQAIAHGHEEVVQLLLAARARLHDNAIEWQDVHGSKSESAMQLASRLGNKTIIQLLLEAEAEINHSKSRWNNGEGNLYDTAFQAGMTQGDDRTVRLFEDADAEGDNEEVDFEAFLWI